ncbi:unnamed protein product [Cochlearia groenlandica]
MNVTVVPPDPGHYLTATDRIGGFVYGLGVSIGILILITTITIGSYYCTRSHISASPTSTPRTIRMVVEVLGLDEKVIKSFPKLIYEEARVCYSLQRESSTMSCCSICLVDYIKTYMIRVLPDCNHLFHDKCVDPWLLVNATCHVCRTSPLPSPVMTHVVDDINFSRREMET